jgi:hypothetical protein
MVVETGLEARRPTYFTTHPLYGDPVTDKATRNQALLTFSFRFSAKLARRHPQKANGLGGGGVRTSAYAKNRPFGRIDRKSWQLAASGVIVPL